MGSSSRHSSYLMKREGSPSAVTTLEGTSTTASFFGEEVFIICLAKLATVGTGIQRGHQAFRWLVNFYHKISGNPIEMWLNEKESFKLPLWIDCLSQLILWKENIMIIFMALLMYNILYSAPWNPGVDLASS